MTEPDPPIELILYSRADCHLCAQMHDALRIWQPTYGFSVREVDVDRDPDLRHRYGARVPVLALGEHEICHYFLDEPALLERLEGSR